MPQPRKFAKHKAIEAAIVEYADAFADMVLMQNYGSGRAVTNAEKRATQAVDALKGFGRKSNRAYDERAIFDGIEGKGNDRRAGFWTWDRDGRVFLWEAYRFHGAWAYGTSAERLQLIAVEK